MNDPFLIHKKMSQGNVKKRIAWHKTRIHDNQQKLYLSTTPTFLPNTF